MLIPNKLKRQFEINRGIIISKKRDYFVRLLKQIEKQHPVMLSTYVFQLKLF